MVKRYLPLLLLAGVILGTFLPTAASAQGLRPEDTFYLKPRVGVAFHLADTEQSPFNFNMDNWKAGTPYAAGLELGYQFSQTTSLGLGWQIVNHPLAYYYGENVPDDADATNVYNSIYGLLRFAGSGRVAPFVGIGGNVTFAQDGRSNDPGFGPSAAIGLDVVLSDRMSLVLEYLANLTFPDDALDGVDEITAFDSDFAPFDVSNAVTLGLKINFESAFTPVEVLSIECPNTLLIGETGTFAATVNADATQPVSLTWNFGDGATGTGVTATHAFDEAGTYTVTVTATNNRSTASRTCPVTVNARPPEIVSMTADPMTFQVCDPVEVAFDANIRGDEPFTYRWEFGDGETAMGEEVTHVYDEPGTYNVTLTVSNDAGTVSRSLTITAQPCTVGICYEITEMNSVFFPRNSSELTAEARAALMENLEIFRECPNLCARLVGYAAPGERNPQALSEARAAAVEQFYTDNGLAASRFVTEGRGVPEGVTTSKKEGAGQYRRVDTLPVQCDDLR